MKYEFETESEMSNCFKQFSVNEFKNHNILILEEEDGLFGIPDFIFIESINLELKHIISIELKLKNWKRALIQAFKYRSFSNLSMVILDEGYINNALKKINMFELSNIGLASFNKNMELKIYYYPTHENEPFSITLVYKLIEKLSKNNLLNTNKINYWWNKGLHKLFCSFQLN